MASLVPQVKINIYLHERRNDGNGDFLYWPGTHLIGDTYAQNAGRFCSWPDQPSGLTRNLLPAGIGRVPYVSIPLEPGDILIFDDRLVHSTSAGLPPRLPWERRLLATTFWGSPEDFSDQYFASAGATREQARAEISQLMLFEASKFGRIYPDAFFKDPEYEFLRPHLTALRQEACDAGTHGEASIFGRNMGLKGDALVLRRG